MVERRSKFALKMISGVLILLVAIMTGLTGCGRNEKEKEGAGESVELSIGYIDSDKLLMEYPAYRKFAEKKEEEGRKIREIIKNTKTDDTGKNASYISKATKKYMQEETKLLEKFIKDVRDASEAVMKEKKLDLVLNNRSTNQVIEYGGVDITSDVQAKMRELKKNKSEEKKK